MKITTIGIDLAKAVFQIHGVDERGNLYLLSKSLIESLAKREASMYLPIAEGRDCYSN
jgi:hypothetical protein